MNETPDISKVLSPIVVLVHCAYADTGSWNAVLQHLYDAGAEAVAAPNPLRGLRKDAAYIANFARQIDAPVVLVGHGYGGAVITNAAAGAGNVVGLVYVAAAAPDEGESLADLLGRFPELALGPALRPSSFPNGGVDYAVEMTLDRELFPQVFAADLPLGQARILAADQRPLAMAGFEEPSGPPAWKFLPSWFAIATEDRIWHPDGQRFVARRAGSIAIEVEASHAVILSQPRAVADLILSALGSLP
jgi:pimeloyl-ACP methyl ester carboxylesterase